jgi:chromosome segregation ATPase
VSIRHTGQPALPEGVAGVYDLSVGEYDVEVNAGRDQGTARQEFVDVMQELFKANPALFQIVGDLFFENMDVPNAQQVAERLKKTLPPGLNDDPGNAQAQAQVGQLQQQMQLMQQALQQAQQEIATKKAELDSKERIAQAEIESKEKIALMNADIAKHKAAIDASLEQTRIQAESARHAASEGREAVAQQLEHAHQARAAQQAAIQAIESQHSEHEHASMMQASKPEKAA